MVKNKHWGGRIISHNEMVIEDLFQSTTLVNINIEYIHVLTEFAKAEINIGTT